MHRKRKMKFKRENICLILLVVMFVGIPALMIATGGRPTERAEPVQRVETVDPPVPEPLAAVIEPETLADGTSFEAVQREAEQAAKVVYGVARDNSRAGKKLTAWCVICRVGNSMYDGSIEDVCSQEAQWMGYSEDNPILRSIYDLCYEELVYWHNGGYLPMEPDFVFLKWTPEEIVLRTDYLGQGNCHYFYEDDWAAFEAARNGEG